MKNVTGVYTAPRQHWVGDGFPVRSMFSYQTHGETRSAHSYCWTTQAPIPSRPMAQNAAWASTPIGFETVTIVYSGEVEHRDSTGKGGVIGSATFSG